MTKMESDFPLSVCEGEMLNIKAEDVFGTDSLDPE